MAEPTSTTGASGVVLIGIGTSLAGVRYGPLATIAVAAFVGTLISLGEVSTSTRRAAAWYVVRYVLMAMVVSGALSYLIERFTGVPAIEVLSLVAFAVGWIGNRWGAVIDAARAGLNAIVARRAG